MKFFITPEDKVNAPLCAHLTEQAKDRLAMLLVVLVPVVLTVIAVFAGR